MSNKRYYKTVDLFGNETLQFCESKERRPDLFTEYDTFVDKFEVKKTTDDCYTPKEVYQVVFDFVSNSFELKDRQIIRPFFPGGDFQSIDYNSSSVVIDNPPFSIISKIARYYCDKNIPFFLFAPHLTLFSSDLDCTCIVVGANITYANGAVVKTSFLSNMFGDIKILGSAQLYEQLQAIENKQKVRLPKYEYPKNVLTVSHVCWLVERGVSIQIEKSSAKHCRGLACQKTHKKVIFGSGFLISKKAADLRVELERTAQKKVLENLEDPNSDFVIVWDLSESEKAIIKSLL